MADANPTLDSTEVAKLDLNRICEQCGLDLKKGQSRFCSKRCIARSARPERHVPIEIRFWSKVKVSSRKNCWPWLGAKNDQGYGHIKIFNWKGTRTIAPAHRVAFELAFRTLVPDGLFACHHCDNPCCCNPWHIFIGTHKDNMNDALDKGRIGKEFLAKQRKLKIKRAKTVHHIIESDDKAIGRN